MLFRLLQRDQSEEIITANLLATRAYDSDPEVVVVVENMEFGQSIYGRFGREDGLNS